MSVWSREIPLPGWLQNEVPAWLKWVGRVFLAGAYLTLAVIGAHELSDAGFRAALAEHSLALGFPGWALLASRVALVAVGAFAALWTLRSANSISFLILMFALRGPTASSDPNRWDDHPRTVLLIWGVGVGLTLFNILLPRLQGWVASLEAREVDRTTGGTAS